MALDLIVAYLIVFAAFNLGRFESSDICLGALFILIYSLIKSKINNSPIKNGLEFKKIPLILSLILTALYWIYSADRLGGGMSSRLFVFCYGVLSLAGVFLLFYFAASKILDWTGSRPERTELEIPLLDEEGYGIRRFGVHRWLIFSGIIFACLLPLFINNFPGTMTVDSFDQLEQVTGVTPYVDHHPWAHTLLISLFYNMGRAISGSSYVGIATYVFAQMIIMSLSMGYVIECMTELGLSRRGQALMILGYLGYPYNLAYAITIWKDVIFAAMVLVFTMTVYRTYRSATYLRKQSVRDGVLFVVSGTFMCLLRHNGLYAFILTMAIMIIIDVRRKIKPQIRYNVLASALVLAVTFAFNGPIQSAFGVEKVDFAHNIPIPLQQVARVVHNHGDISPRDMEMIERINVSSYLVQHYEPGGADPTMQWVVYGDSEYLEAHKLEYLGLWIRLGFKNPHAYFDAYVDQTRGYYTTMYPEQTEYYGILPNNMGLAPQSPIPVKIRFKINEILNKLGGMLPVYGILYSPGACLQLVLLGIAIILNKRDQARGKLVVYVPVLTLVLTVLIATPLCADLRYAYPLVLGMPTLIAITLT